MTLNRPGRFNVLSSAMLTALQLELDAVASDPSVRVLIIAGSGRAFCAGHDLREMQQHHDQAWQRALFEQCSRVMLSINRIPQPVIARVHGVATAAGCQLVAACDLAVAGQSARFATSGINLGLFCSTPAVALTRTLSSKRAAEMLFTGEFIDAALAAQWGLVNRCVDDNALDMHIQAMADTLASKSSHALSSGKALLRHLNGVSLAEAYTLASENMAADMSSPEAVAGITAFVGRRPMPDRDLP
jgi:enoyl-CoA hydratase/carnithine racemase